MKSIFSVTIHLFLLFPFLCPSLTAQSNYKLNKTVHINGDGGWDYLAVDEMNHRLFISHSTIVQVIDCSNDSLIAIIPDTKGVHGIAIANDLNKGFISNGKDSSVTVFDLTSLKTLCKLNIKAKNPDAILYDSFKQRIYTFNGGDNTATVIDGNTLKVIKKINLDGKPEFAVSDKMGKIYFNLEDLNMVCEIDANTMEIMKKWSILPGSDPSGLTLDEKTHCLISVCGNKLMVISDVSLGKILCTVPIGDHCDGVIFDPLYKRAYASNGEGTITVVQEKDANTFELLETIPTMKGARTITLNKNNHHIYVVTAQMDTESTSGHRKYLPDSFVLYDYMTLK